MKNLVALFCLVVVVGLRMAAQAVQSPADFLGYELGDRFTPHYRVVAYFEQVAEQSPWVELEYYGSTYEHRPLLVAYISDPSNINKRDAIKSANQKRAGMQTGDFSEHIPIVWLSYNVHGNESVSTEASMLTLYELITRAECQDWLSNTLVVMDPCINPDGRDRYVNWYNRVAHQVPNPHLDDIEHHEPWPGGRTNHYLFDLNRDWAWQTQQESRHRIKLYNQWLPHVHVDFHEQSINSPYYFAPAAEPYHQLITSWQREFQTMIGRNHARYFHQQGWLYFTKEIFDLLYPSYGDTYPTFNGSIGMTYEQGGSGRAGLQVINETGDTLTLKDRIAHHHTTGLSTVEVTSMNADRVLSEFERYFNQNKTNPQGTYKSYIIKNSDPQKLQRLADFLDLQMIQYGTSEGRRNLRGLRYSDQTIAPFNVDPGDMVISTYQPKSVLAQALLDPQPRLSDTLTYDITGWAIPYQFGLEAYATQDRLPIRAWPGITENPPKSLDGPYAYLLPWKDLDDAKWLGHLLKKGVTTRFAEEPFTMEGRAFAAGTLVITRADNQDLPDLDQMVISGAPNDLMPVSSGWVEQGKDLGSSIYHVIKKPRIALLSGDDTYSYSFGEIWYFMEQDIDYPVTIIDTRYFQDIELGNYDVLIIPGGQYDLSDQQKNSLKEWIRNGGRLVLIQHALNSFVDQEGFALKSDTTETEAQQPPLKKYGDRQRTALSEEISGAVFKVEMDVSHPLAFGFQDQYFTLKTSDLSFPFLQDHWNVGVISDNRVISGFAGFEALKRQHESLVFGVEDIGSGEVVYLVDNPLFRAFWHQGKLLVANAIFLVGN